MWTGLLSWYSSTFPNTIWNSVNCKNNWDKTEIAIIKELVSPSQIKPENTDKCISTFPLVLTFREADKKVISAID